MKITEYFNNGCVPCMVFKKRLSSLKTKYGEKLELEFKNIGDASEDVEKYHIQCAPFLVIEHADGNVETKSRPDMSILTELEKELNV